MDELNKDDWLVGGLALLLAISLLFLPWFSITITFLGVSRTGTASATGSPDGWTGILALLASLAVLADVLIERLSPQTTLPNLGGSRTNTRLYLAGAAAVFVALKFVLHLHFSWFGFGFYTTVILAAALVYVTLRLSQDRPVLNVAAS